MAGVNPDPAVRAKNRTPKGDARTGSTHWRKRGAKMRFSAERSSQRYYYVLFEFYISYLMTHLEVLIKIYNILNVQEQRNFFFTYYTNEKIIIKKIYILLFSFFDHNSAKHGSEIFLPKSQCNVVIKLRFASRSSVELYFLSLSPPPFSLFFSKVKSHHILMRHINY